MQTTKGADMRYVLFGDSGLRVSELALGTMTFGDDWGWGADAAESRKQLEVFAEAGGNLIDTANKYTNGSAERIVGGLIAADRDRWVVSTKYTLSMGPDPNASGNSRKNLVRSLEASLRRLDTDYVDILWVHAWDFLTSPSEVMRALDDQVSAGKVLYLGVSDAPAWQIARMQTMAELRGWNPLAGLQVEHSLVQRDVERELLPMADALGLGVTAWAPLGGGVLTGKYRSLEGERRYAEQPEWKLRVGDAVVEVANELGFTPAQVALAWLRQHTEQPIIPLIGARTAAQLEQSLAVTGIALPQEHLDRLSAVSAPTLGFPHDFLAQPDIRQVVLGDQADLIVPPRRPR
ncbi:aldo/keto reductase [Allokutzneria sp. A3M-2-11 16]|uniref:aldo/keto reductase n=1 Tax=Allokutzneria sp. A3M-2-11 16 TaxID=2962043 RepID=UPI0020B69DA8|nr:aldo/keto reductase [Allokutzneria sp. A3M-2-11 16]MCP3797865.1 aldo/keto reductase [Allokutzneria sp. A3M-2-11 16]